MSPIGVVSHAPHSIVSKTERLCEPWWETYWFFIQIYLSKPKEKKILWCDHRRTIIRQFATYSTDNTLDFYYVVDLSLSSQIILECSHESALYRGETILWLVWPFLHLSWLEWSVEIKWRSTELGKTKRFQSGHQFEVRTQCTHTVEYMDGHGSILRWCGTEICANIFTCDSGKVENTFGVVTGNIRFYTNPSTGNVVVELF